MALSDTDAKRIKSRILVCMRQVPSSQSGLGSPNRPLAYSDRGEVEAEVSGESQDSGNGITHQGSGETHQYEPKPLAPAAGGPDLNVLRTRSANFGQPALRSATLNPLEPGFAAQ